MPTLSVTTEYGRDLLRLLRDGPGYITPADLRGLIAFPSYHGVLAILLIWYARSVRWLRGLVSCSRPSAPPHRSSRLRELAPGGRSPTAEARALGARQCGFESRRPHY